MICHLFSVKALLIKPWRICGDHNVPFLRKITSDETLVYVRGGSSVPDISEIYQKEDRNIEISNPNPTQETLNQGIDILVYQNIIKKLTDQSKFIKKMPIHSEFKALKYLSCSSSWCCKWPMFKVFYHWYYDISYKYLFSRGCYQ